VASRPYPLIFIIDDDEAVRESLRAMLEAHSFSVVDFPSGDEFLRRRAGKTPACLILDVNMPQMTGIDVLKALRAAGDQTPAILVSGRRDSMMQMHAMALGTPLLDKPLPAGVLVAAIRQAASL
jgi:two-component system, LuxR family, response regulator FixJ